MELFEVKYIYNLNINFKSEKLSILVVDVAHLLRKWKVHLPRKKKVPPSQKHRTESESVKTFYYYICTCTCVHNYLF